MYPELLSALSKRNLAQQRSWDGLMTGRNLSPHSQGSWAGHTEAAVTASRFSHGSSTACQAISQFIKDRLFLKWAAKQQINPADVSRIPRWSRMAPTPVYISFQSSSDMYFYVFF